MNPPEQRRPLERFTKLKPRKPTGKKPIRMPNKKPKTKSKPPEQTFEEPAYLRHLIENRTPIRVRLVNNEEVSGIVEFYDASFIRLTREEGPNLFLYKHEIKYLYEEG